MYNQKACLNEGYMIWPIWDVRPECPYTCTCTCILKWGNKSLRQIRQNKYATCFC